MANNLTSRGARANNAARLSALPASTSKDPDLRRWQEAVRECIEIRLGARRDRFERAVTFRDLDPIVEGILKRLAALEKDSGSATTVDDCCAELRLAIAQLRAELYLLRTDVDALDDLMQGRLGDLKDRVIPGNTGVDQYWESVILLVQGGEVGSSTIQDYSTYADTTTINNYAAWDDGYLVGSANALKLTTINAGIDPFISPTGTRERFGRSTGDKFTMECWVNIVTTENFGSSSFFWAWWQPGGSNPIFQIGTGNASLVRRLRIRNGIDTDILTEELDAGEHFIQVNFDGDNYTVDVDGVEFYSGTNSYSKDLSGQYQFQVASYTSTGSSSGPSTEVYVGPLRVTKGVLRERGVVPTGLFPTEGPTVLGPTGYAVWLTDSAGATASARVLTIALFDGVPQAGIGHLSTATGTNTIAARSGKVYLEVEVQASSADGYSFIGLADNALFTGGYATTDDPETSGFYVVHNNASLSAGVITNGVHATNVAYDFPPGTVIGLAVDFATGKVWVSIAGTYVSGDPAAGTSPTFTLPDAEFTFVAGGFESAGSASVAYTVRSSNGNTSYSPPTGFTWYS